MTEIPGVNAAYIGHLVKPADIELSLTPPITHTTKICILLLLCIFLYDYILLHDLCFIKFYLK